MSPTCTWCGRHGDRLGRWTRPTWDRRLPPATDERVTVCPDCTILISLLLRDEVARSTPPYAARARRHHDLKKP